MGQDYVIIEGYVEHIVFRNEENGYTVFNFETKEADWTCVGTFSFISEGAYLELTGREYENDKYQQTQFQVVAFTEKQPDDVIGMERYLGSGAIKGIGPNLAKRIVKKFKLDTFRIIEEEPERLAEVKGVSERIAMSVATQFEENREMREAMLYLQKYKIPNHYAFKIYNTYKDEMYQILRENPYRIAEDITGIGFRSADEIARHMGIEMDSEYRIRSGLVYVMSQAILWGHTYLPEVEFYEKARQLLNIQSDDGLLKENVDELLEEKKLLCRADEQGLRKIYLPNLYFSELETARKLLDMNSCYEALKEEIPKENGISQEAEVQIGKIESKLKITLDALQKQAIYEATSNGVTIITGGPGTGKTTIINSILEYFEMEQMEVLLAAPTGRAAKRMTEATGYESKTIHRLLEVNGGIEENSRNRFERDEDNPLEADVIIVDEASMVDIFLMCSLCKAITVGTRLILVGDVNQLPSVGPGNVLKDMIASDKFSTVRLTHIYRQDENSRIVSNAHKINAGELIPMDNKSNDFFLMPRKRVPDVIDTTISLVKERISQYLKVSPYDVQVLAPMRKGDVGVNHLNEVLQQELNPKAPGKNEYSAGKIIYREGDKVMQIKNNYKLEWVKQTTNGHIVDSGEGVFNGDVGTILHISEYAQEITVVFDEGHEVVYPFGIVDELELAYAVTVHKSQGCEYPAIIIPLLSGPQVLFNRNLLYTAVTRAKNCVVLVGDMNTVTQMIHNNNEQKRYSSLRQAILECRK